MVFLTPLSNSLRINWWLPRSSLVKMNWRMGLTLALSNGLMPTFSKILPLTCPVSLLTAVWTHWAWTLSLLLKALLTRDATPNLTDCRHSSCSTRPTSLTISRLCLTPWTSSGSGRPCFKAPARLWISWKDSTSLLRKALNASSNTKLNWVLLVSLTSLKVLLFREPLTSPSRTSRRSSPTSWLLELWLPTII